LNTLAAKGRVPSYRDETHQIQRKVLYHPILKIPMVTKLNGPLDFIITNKTIETLSSEIIILNLDGKDRRLSLEKKLDFTALSTVGIKAPHFSMS